MANKHKKSSSRKKSSGGPPPRRRRDGKAALRGMVIGGIVFALIAMFFMLRIGGRTPFNHLADALRGDEAAEAPAEPAGTNNAAPAPATPRPATPKPAAPAGAGTAPPQDHVTEGEQRDLDKLIESKTK